MFKKELVDVLKQTGWFLAASLALAGALPAFRIVPRQPYTAVLVPVLQVGLLFWGLFLGVSAFGRERRQRAMEYALSLPYSRRELLFRLAGARLMVLAGLWVLSAIAALLWIKPAGAEGALWLGMGLALYSLVLFTIALSLSPMIENFIALCLVTIVVWFSTIPLVFLLGRAFAWARGWNVSALPKFSYEGSPLILPSMYPSWLLYMSILLGILPFAAALYFSIPKFDLRPSAAYKKHFAGVLAAGLAACLAGGFITAALTYSDYTYMRSITPDHKLVEFGEMGLRIRSSAAVQRIRNGYPLGWPPGTASGGRLVYNEGEVLFLLDTASGEKRAIYDSRGSRPDVDQGWVCGEQVLFLARRESRSPVRTLHVVDLDSSDVRKFGTIRFTLDASPLLKLKRPFGTGRKDGRRFWLFVSDPPRMPPLRIWEDNQIQEITDGQSRFVSDAVYINDLVLLLTSDGLMVFRDLGNSFELAKTIADGFSFNTSWWNDFIPDQPEAEILYGVRGDQVAKLDLKSLEISDLSTIKPAAGAQVFAFLPDRFYLVERILADKSLIVSAIHDDKIERLKEFTGLPIDQSGARLEVQREGILVHRGKRITAYAFPDLREIHY